MREIWDFSFNFRLIIITVGPLEAAVITMHMAQSEENVSLRAKTDGVIY